MSKGKPGKGAATNTVEYAPWRLEKMAKAKKRKERQWENKAGPVVTDRLPWICDHGHWSRTAENPCTQCGSSNWILAKIA